MRRSTWQRRPNSYFAPPKLPFWAVVLQTAPGTPRRATHHKGSGWGMCLVVFERVNKLITATWNFGPERILPHRYRLTVATTSIDRPSCVRGLPRYLGTWCPPGRSLGQGSAEAVTVVVVTARADVVKILVVGAGKVVVVWEAGVSLDSCRSHACPSIRAALAMRYADVRRS